MNRRRPKLRAPETDNGRDPELNEAAVRLLARREHAAGELASKLEQRGYARAAIDAEIEKHEPEILAPTHGNVMVGDAVHYMDLMKTVVNHFAVEGIPPEIAL